MIVGSVKELKPYEYRVGLTPANVADYVQHGHSVLIEREAGLASSFTDEQYAAAGARIVDAGEVWARADMIIKVKEPLENEYPLMRRGQILYTYLHLAASRELTCAMLDAGVIGVAYETIQDPKGTLPLLTPMSEVAGRLSVLEGAKHLEKPMGGRGVLLGGVPGTPSGRIVVLGAGVVGANACRTAIGLGAQVTVMDINLDRLRYLDDVFGPRIHTLFSTPTAIAQALASADLVIGAVLIPGGAAPKLIKKEYLRDMLPGSVIVDVAIDQGGCCETSHPTYHDHPTFTVDGVIHYCVGNMPGAVPWTSTTALTNATLRHGLMIADLGLTAACARDPGLKPGINTYLGKLTLSKVAEAVGLDYEELPL